MELKLLGTLILAGVFLFMWFVNRPEDQFGRPTEGAYGIALGLIFATLFAFYLIIFG